MKSAVQATSLWQASLGFLLIIGLIFLVGYLLRKTQQINCRKTSTIKILGGVSLGAKERLVIVKINQKNILLGVTPNRISKLEEFETPIEEVDSENTISFVQHLRKALKRDR